MIDPERANFALSFFAFFSISLLIVTALIVRPKRKGKRDGVV